MKLYWSSEPDPAPTRLLRVVAGAHRWFPNRYSRKASLDLSSFAATSYREMVPGADPLMHAKWATHVRCEGRGSLNFLGGFHLENDVVFTGDGDIFFGPSVWIDESTTIRVDRNEFVGGKNLRIGANCHIDASGGVCVGDNVLIESRVQILSANHGFEARGIRIGSNVRIGANAILLDGVHIDDDEVIDAGSIVMNLAPVVMRDLVSR